MSHGWVLGGAGSPAPPTPTAPGPTRPALPELGRVAWRARVDSTELRRRSRWWTLSALSHVVPLCGAAAVLALLSPLTIPVGVILLAHAWAIPELYANRGAKVVRRRSAADPTAERVSIGLLGDLIDHEARELQRRSGLVLERGRLGVWLVGEAGALLLRAGGHTVLCFCVRATDAALAPGDRIAHLLLALRQDEVGFATVANLAFAGARWRVRRRLAPAMRPAIDRARAVSLSDARADRR